MSRVLARTINDGLGITRSTGTNDKRNATTAFVQQAIGGQFTAMGTICFGATNLGAAATRYMRSVGGGSAASEFNASFIPPAPIIIKDLYASTNAAPGAGKSFTFTLRVDGADTALTAAISESNTTANDTSNVIYVSAGVEVSLKVESSAGTAGTEDLTASIRCLMLDNSSGESIWPYAGATSANDYLGHLNQNSATAGNLDMPVARTCFVSDFANTGGAGTYGIIVNGTEQWSFAGSGATYPNIIVGNGVRLVANDYLRVRVTSASNERGALRIRDASRFGVYSPLWFSSGNQAQNTTRYMSGPGLSGATTENEVQIPIAAGVIRNLAIRNADTGVGGQTWTVTVRKNGADTGVTATMSGTAVSALDITNSVTFDAGDLLSLKCVSSATTGTCRIHATVEHHSS